MRAVGVVVVACILGAADAHAAPPSPFERAVNDAIDRAVVYLIEQQNEDGGWDAHYDGAGSGLPMLCILEQPLAVHRNDFHRGYRRLSPEAQASVRAAARYLPTRDPALLTSRNAHST